MFKKFFEKLSSGTIDYKYFDFYIAEDYFEKYKKDLVLGELLILGNESVSEVYIKDGGYIKSLNRKYETIKGVKRTEIGVPCMHLIYINGSEEYIPCYYVISENTLTKRREYLGDCKVKVLEESEVEELRSIKNEMKEGLNSNEER